MKRFVPGLLALLAFSPAYAQTLDSFQATGEITRGNARQVMAAEFKKAAFEPTPTCSVELYKVRYWSTGLKGERTLLSGLVALPRDSKPKGMVVFMHGTTAVRDNVPSRMTLTSGYSPEALFAVVGLACGGYVLAAPDYLGQGDSPGPHPYVLGKVNAQSGIDIIRAARELAAQKKRTIGSNLYVTGYSEGGGNAMWLARRLMEGAEPSMTLTAAAPISGPYDLTGAQAKAMLERQTSVEDVALRLFFIGYYAYSVAQCYGELKLDTVFVPSFASYLPTVFGRDFPNDQQYVEQLAWKGLQLGSLLSVARVLTPTFKTALASGDRTNAAMEPLYANDCYDWTPSKPLYLLGIPGDNLVVFDNTRNAMAAMRKRGVGGEIANSYGLKTKGLNHLNAIAPLLVWVRRFLDEGFAGVPKD